MTQDGTTIAGASAPTPAPGVAALELDGETVLFDERSGSLHLVDAVGTVIWNRLDGSKTLDDLTRELSATFATDERRVRADLVEFVRELDRHHLLEGVAPTATAR